MAIHIRREGNITYVVADTVADWVDALPLGLPMRSRTAIPECPLPDKLDDSETFDQLMARSNKLYEETIAEENAARKSSPGKDAAAG